MPKQPPPLVDALAKAMVRQIVNVMRFIEEYTDDDAARWTMLRDRLDAFTKQPHARA